MLTREDKLNRAELASTIKAAIAASPYDADEIKLNVWPELMPKDRTAKLYMALSGRCRMPKELIEFCKSHQII